MFLIVGISAAVAVIVGFLLSSEKETYRALGWGVSVAWLISIGGILAYTYLFNK